MIGDGVNDAAALKTAHVSFAMASGTDIALGSSDAVMYTTDLRVIPWAMALSREAMRVVRRNIFRATAYNILGVSLAACGMLHPITAALLMVFSSLLVAWSSVRIGVPANFDHCFAPPISVAKARFDLGLTLKMFLHMAAFFGQAWMAVRMLELTGTAANLVILGFTISGGILSLLWSNQKEIGHDLDMSFGMISLGNFGMLLGWWADNSFQPFQNLGTCECVEAMHRGVFKPWMWLLMLLFSNLAMLFAARRPHPNLRYHRFAMFTGGNVGMVLGMFAGGWLASRIVTDQIQTGALLSFTGMTLGMIIGMWLLTRITQESILWMLSLGRIPGWLRTADSASAEFLDTTGLPK
jgi:magnesium-transporting ATPase (P-type)